MIERTDTASRCQGPLQTKSLAQTEVSTHPYVRRVPTCRVARTWRIMRRIQTRDLRSKRGVFLLCGAPACFPVISQGETSNDRGNQDNS